MKLLRHSVVTFLFVSCLHAGVVEQDSLIATLSPTDQEFGTVQEDRLKSDSKARYELTALHAEDEHDTRNLLLIAAIENIRSTDTPGVRVGLGFNLHRAYLGTYDKSVSALALKGRLGYIIETPVKTTLMARVSYAPKPLCLSDEIQSYTHTRLLAEFGLFKRGNLIAGFRTIHYTMRDGTDYTFNNTLYGGIRLFY